MTLSLSPGCLLNRSVLSALASEIFAPLTAVKRENVKEFFRWAFLNTDVDDPTYDDEVEEYVKSIELGTGLNFEDGRADVKCLRLTLDKVDALHRSLVWYSVRFPFRFRIASVHVLVSASSSSTSSRMHICASTTSATTVLQSRAFLTSSPCGRKLF